MLKISVSRMELFQENDSEILNRQTGCISGKLEETIRDNVNLENRHEFLK